MERISENDVKLTTDEQIIGDFYGYLIEERGFTPYGAMDYLKALSAKVGDVLSGDFLDYMAYEPGWPEHRRSADETITNPDQVLRTDG